MLSGRIDGRRCSLRWAAMEVEPDPAAATDPETQVGPIPDSGVVLRGQTVAPGLALGPVRLQIDEMSRGPVERIPADAVDRELNRFRQALIAARTQLEDLRDKLRGRVPEDEARILDTHTTYLRDSVFIADVEHLILNERLRLEAAIAKVIGDFDRIFRLVQNATLRQSAIDLRDVGLRVLRNLASEESDSRGDEPSSTLEDALLVARKLSIVDLFTLRNERIQGIATEEGGLTGHAAIFARSMRIPTLIGIEGLCQQVSEGDFVILDATEGTLRVNPGIQLRRQYAQTARTTEDEGRPSLHGDWTRPTPRLKDGLEVEVLASCGNLPEAQQAGEIGLPGIGLYRTELLYLVDPLPPSRDALSHHYRAVISAISGQPVTFRLVNIDSSMGVPYLHMEREKNPNLGRVGIRALLANEGVLRRQLEALLIAGAKSDLRVAVPFVIDVQEFSRLREILVDVRQVLRRDGLPYRESIDLGIVLETPAAIFGLDDLAAEADFVAVNLDALQQHLLCMDRNDTEFARTFASLHPFCLRALQEIVVRANAASTPLSVFGVSSRQGENTELLLGCGFRSFCVPPALLEPFLERVQACELAKAVELVERRAAESGSSQADRFAGYRHGYSPP
jgi:phosphoenolpyruvate-protein kinase (PTS system EI component)